MFTRSCGAALIAALPSRSRSPSARRGASLRGRTSASRSLRPTSRPGTSASCRTAPACRPAAARRRRAHRSTRRSAPRATARTARAASNAALVGGQPLTNGIETTKTIANFWPYATTLFDFTRRAMPWQQAAHAHQRGSLCAHRLHPRAQQDHRRERRDERQTLPKVRMPNRDGFIVRFPDKMP